MSIIAPQTDVYLLKVPLEIDEKNQLDFASATAQSNYFLGLQKILLENFTYQRKDGVIRVPLLIDDIIEYNYVMYRNEGHGSKWYFAFITGMEYMNDNVTAVSIKTDPWQTYQFDLTYKKTFVEREHVNDDSIGANTVIEGLDVGEYEIVDLKNIPIYETLTPSTDWTVAFVCDKLPDGLENIDHASDLLGGVFNAMKIFAVGNIEQARTLLHIYNETGRPNDTTVGDDIKNMYMVPTCCVNKSNNVNTTLSTTIGGQSKVAVLYPLYNYFLQDNNGTPFEYRQPKVLAGNYTPVNNKLYTYPYSYFYITNNAGTDVQYNWEDFPSLTAGQYDTGKAFQYRKAMVPTVSMSAKLYPTSYKTYSDNGTTPTCMWNYGINYSKTPVCSWTTDYYTNWLTQNGINVGLSGGQSIFGGLAAGVGMMSVAGLPGLAAGLAVGTVKGVTDCLMADHKAQTTPNQAYGDLNTSDVMYAFSRCSMKLYMMSVRPEFAKILDGYFSVYGYKVNSVKTPNITGRKYWNYVKTIGCYIDADIPQSDLQEIKDMFDRGITFWHDPTKFLDYSQSNTIVS